MDGPLITNIFCLIGKPGSGRETIQKNILSRKEFIDKYNIKKLVYGTTRPIKPGDIEGETYHFFTDEEYANIDSDELIESRSYDNYGGKIYYYFTLKNYIMFGDTYIAKVSTQQYVELKKWALTTQMSNPTCCINIYPIMITAPIFEREKRMMSKASTDADVYNMCIKLVAERYEFCDVINKNPELIDNMNHNSCILDNSKSGRHNIILLGDQLQKFIEIKILMQGL